MLNIVECYVEKSDGGHWLNTPISEVQGRWHTKDIAYKSCIDLSNIGLGVSKALTLLSAVPLLSFYTYTATQNH